MKKTSLTVGILAVLMTSIVSAQGLGYQETTPRRVKQSRPTVGARQTMAPASTTSNNEELTLDNYDAQGSLSTTVRRPVARGSLMQIAPVLGYAQSSFANVQAQNGAKLENLGGLNGGAELLIGREKLQLETGLIYAERGAKISNIAGIQTNTYNYKYLEIPLLAKYAFQPRTSSQFFVKGGLVAGLLQEAKVKQEGGGFTLEANIKDQYNAMDLRAALGLGGTLRINRTMGWLIQADYQQSLGKINKESPAGSVDLFNMSLGISTGLSIDI
ncbi:MAG: PorT family protein [Bdellovibrionaceae bacterium]|nr:PorT family protein [Pseudobdellovibrionaceae bacterium]